MRGDNDALAALDYRRDRLVPVRKESRDSILEALCHLTVLSPFLPPSYLVVSNLFSRVLIIKQKKILSRNFLGIAEKVDF